MITTLLATLLALGILIFIHEFGHFIVAKLSGIRVERFSLGYPPRAFGFKRGDTDYCISWLPFGGYCKMSGMIDESLEKDSIKGRPWEFQSKHPLIRFAVILAGPGMNYILAIFIFTMIFFYLGVAVPSNKPFVGGVMENSPAEKADIKEGDIILSIDGKNLTTWEQMTEIIRSNTSDTPQRFEWKRGEEIYTAEILSVKDEKFGKMKRIIGIYQAVETRNVGILGAVKEGFIKSYDITVMVVVLFKKAAAGEVSLKNSLGGPLAIAKYAGESARAGWWNYIGFVALLSLNLGLINLLPIPALDGGHLFFIIVEEIIRRPIPLKFKLVVQQIGMALLFLLMAFIVYNDFVRFL